MDGRVLSGIFMRSAHRELQIVALACLAAAALSGGCALWLGVLQA